MSINDEFKKSTEEIEVKVEEKQPDSQEKPKKKLKYFLIILYTFL